MAMLGRIKRDDVKFCDNNKHTSLALQNFTLWFSEVSEFTYNFQVLKLASWHVNAQSASSPIYFGDWLVVASGLATASPLTKKPCQKSIVADSR
jgi:DNA phosphorothioation-dependent restriction protein DptG